MRKFKYKKNNLYSADRGLTTGRVYDMIEYKSDEFSGEFPVISFINDFGKLDYFYLSPLLFDEVTIEYRNELIDDILK